MRTEHPLSLSIVPRSGAGRWRLVHVILATLSACALQGCSRAPSRNILGSYFPSWMVCALLALVMTIVVRAVLARTGVDAELPAPLVTYMAIFAAFTFAVWLIWLA